MKKWLFPVASLIIFPVLFLSLGLFTTWITGNNDTGYFGVIVVFCGMLLSCIVLKPIACFIYIKRCLIEQKYRFLFTLYHSLLISLPYFVFCEFIVTPFNYGFIILAWCVLWSLFGLAKYKNKDESTAE